MKRKGKKPDWRDAELARLQAKLNRLEALRAGRPPSAIPTKTPEPQEPPPVFSECVIGYRVWTIDPLGRLRPQAVDNRPWVPGENTAVCDAHVRNGLVYGGFTTMIYGSSWSDEPDKPAPKNHAAPAKGCHCGLYARFNPEDLQIPEYDLDANSVVVCGAIAGWGTMQVHRDGMRAEKAYVVALATTDDMPPEIRALVERVAETYRVPAVPFAALADEGLLHGTPLPEEAMPPTPKTPKTGDFLSVFQAQVNALQLYSSSPNFHFYGGSKRKR